MYEYVAALLPLIIMESLPKASSHHAFLSVPQRTSCWYFPQLHAMQELTDGVLLDTAPDILLHTA